ncbi:diagnostic antigen gp50 [Echinococcus multilocularis]|uniref:Diagnostic antigen gp50 n=1 Tax=Echinococcus multilocularis TaxID=6211 RepID=A0A068Y299_ECHMU|nr:diagnostic antigen gp50 [Echinococcus multilocularis]
MLAIIAVLLCVACCSGETSPHLWGSRVVGKPSGKSDTMNYRYGDQFLAVVRNTSSVSQLWIENANCIVNNTIWGTPCQDHNGTASVTLNDHFGRLSFPMIRLRCNNVFCAILQLLTPFTRADEVDLRTSFPLSRFVQGQQSFSIDFAVGGAESDGVVLLERNGVTICEWEGVKIYSNKSTICHDLVKNITSDLRIFHANFTLLPNVQREVLTWTADKNRLSVTVDYTQSGISPEVAECNTSTTSSGPASTPTTSAPTTSSGREMAYTLRVVFAVLSMLMLLNKLV